MHTGLKLALTNLTPAKYELYIDASTPDLSSQLAGATLTQSNADLVYRIIDHASVNRGVPQNGLPRSGLRVVRNYAEKDLTLWSKVAGLTATALGSGEYQLTFDAANKSFTYTTPAIVPSCAGRTAVFSLKIKGTAGETIRIYVRDSANTEATIKDLTLTTEFTRFSAAVTFSTGVTSNGLTIIISTFGGVTARDIIVRDVQLQDTTGSSTLTIPDEYVDPTADYGAGVVGVRAFTTVNGNSVSGSGIVTEAVGASIDLSDVGIDSWEATTNKCLKLNTAPADTTTQCTTFDAGVGATFSVVTDSAALIAAGLGAAVPGGTVLRVVAGTGNAGFNISGQCGNLNAHSLSVWGRVSSGVGRLAYSDWGGLVTFTNTSYQKIISKNVTPTLTTRTIRLAAEAGATAYFILWKLTETRYDTADIPITSSGSAVARTALALSKGTPNYAMIGAPFTFFVRGKWLASPLDHVAGFPRVLHMTDTAGSAYQLMVYYNVALGAYAFKLTKNSVVDIDTPIWTTSPSSGDKFAAAIVYDGSSYISYINGALQYTHTTAVTLDSNFNQTYICRPETSVSISARFYKQFVERGAWSSARAIAETTV